MTVASGSASRPIGRRLVPLALVYLMVGLATAMASPFLALFLTTAVRSSPWQVTLFLFATPLSAVAASTSIGRFSDGRWNRRTVIIAAALAGSASAVVMALTREFWVLLGVAVTVTASSVSLLPQVFAYARETLQGSNRTAMAMSMLRTLFSIAWVAGPPVAAVILEIGGFRYVYASAALMFLLTTAVAVIWLGRGSARLPQASVSDTGVGVDAPRRRVWMTMLGFVLLQCAGSIGVQALPLFIGQDLHGGVRDAGLILGLCAGLEIPLMLGFGMLSTRVSLHRLLLIGAGCSVSYYAVATLSGASWQLAVAQLLNATSIAANGGLGVTYVQDMLPRHPGRASTLFTNGYPAGAMLAGPILGAAQHLGYRSAYGAAAVLAASGLVVLASGRRRSGARPTGALDMPPAPRDHLAVSGSVDA